MSDTTEIKKYNWSLDQQKALDTLFNGNNCFLRGAAGTGKSTLLDYFCTKKMNEGLKVLKCAPTGLAASNFTNHNHINELIGTIHQTFWPEINFRVYNKNIWIRPAVIDKIALYDIVVIDEISMCRIDLFHYVSKAIDFANNRRETIGKNKIQFIVTGDFCQLPPVLEKYVPWKAIQKRKPKWKFDDQQILSEYGENKYGDVKKYAFESEWWRYWNFFNIKLETIWRQKNDKIFQMLLNSLKFPEGHEQFLADEINAITKKIPGNLPSILLYSKNKEANKANENYLNAIQNNSFISKGFISNEIIPSISNYEDLETYIANLRKSEETDEYDPEILPGLLSEIKLKVNANIIFTKNDTFSLGTRRRFSNGTIAKIVEIFAANDGDIKKIRFRLTNSEEFDLTKDECRNKILREPYLVINEITGEKELRQSYFKQTYVQFPIKLAYAITIHKSQGQTYDFVKIDPSNIFEENQLYVALSRAKTINHVELINKLWSSHIKSSDIVRDFCSELGDKSDIDSLKAYADARDKEKERIEEQERIERRKAEEIERMKIFRKLNPGKELWDVKPGVILINNENEKCKVLSIENSYLYVDINGETVRYHWPTAMLHGFLKFEHNCDDN